MLEIELSLLRQVYIVLTIATLSDPAHALELEVKALGAGCGGKDGLRVWENVEGIYGFPCAGGVGGREGGKVPGRDAQRLL